MPPNEHAIQSSERHRPPVLTSKNISIVVTGAVLIVALFKADSKDIPQIVDTLVQSNVWAAVGWTLAGAFLFAAAVIVKLLTRLHDKEMKRITTERDGLQSMLLGNGVKRG